MMHLLATSLEFYIQDAGVNYFKIRKQPLNVLVILMEESLCLFVLLLEFYTHDPEGFVLDLL